MGGNMRRSIHLVMFTAVVTTYLSCVSPPSKSQELITSGERIFGLGWDSGTVQLYLENTQRQRKSVQISFQGERNERLTLLVIRTDDWSLDLRQYVRDLSFPFPSRILLLAPDVWEGRSLPRLRLSLPYAVIIRRTEDSESRIQCNALDIVIVDGKVIGTSIEETNAGRCVQ